MMCPILSTLKFKPFQDNHSEIGSAASNFDNCNTFMIIINPTTVQFGVQFNSHRQGPKTS